MMMKIKREGEDMDYLVHNIAINLNHFVQVATEIQLSQE